MAPEIRRIPKTDDTDQIRTDLLLSVSENEGSPVFYINRKTSPESYLVQQVAEAALQKEGSTILTSPIIEARVRGQDSESANITTTTLNSGTALKPLDEYVFRGKKLGGKRNKKIEKLVDEGWKQVKFVEDLLAKYGLDHGHLHEGNIVVMAVHKRYLEKLSGGHIRECYKVLREDLTDPQKVRKLIDSGDISYSLNDILDDVFFHRVWTIIDWDAAYIASHEKVQKLIMDEVVQDTLGEDPSSPEAIELLMLSYEGKYKISVDEFPIFESILTSKDTPTYYKLRLLKFIHGKYFYDLTARRYYLGPDFPARVLGDVPIAVIKELIESITRHQGTLIKHDEIIDEPVNTIDDVVEGFGAKGDIALKQVREAASQSS